MAKYRDFKSGNENNLTSPGKVNRSNHNKSTYSPPPRMLQQKILKQNESEKKKNIQSQTEVCLFC